MLLGPVSDVYLLLGSVSDGVAQGCCASVAMVLSLWKGFMCRIDILSFHYSGSTVDTAFNTAWMVVAWTEC